MPRSLNRRLDRSLTRSLCRHTTRMTNGCSRPRPLNYIARAILASRKVIRARRQLMRLAPRVFDMAVVDREREAATRQAAHDAECQRAIAKVYEVDLAEVIAKWPRQTLSPWPKCARTLRAIEREMAARELWLQIGQKAMQDNKEQRPHRTVSLNEICGLITVASGLGRLATGLETLQRPEIVTEEPHLSFQAALEKVYGCPEMTTENSLTGAKTV